jgi:hypothetical protein
MLVLYIHHQKKSFAKYIWCTYNWWQITLFPVVSSSGMTYAYVVSILAENTIDIWHTSPLIPQVASVHLMIHGQHCICYENVFMSWGRDNKTSLGPHALGARSWPVARQTRSPYHMIGTILKQTSSWGDGSRVHITWQEDTYLFTFRCCVITEKEIA